MKQGEINNCSGFTLLEIMIVIGLMVIFAVLTIPYGMNFYQSRILEEETRAVSNILARAQSHAMAGKEDSDWGIRFYHNEAKYVLFKGSRYNQRDTAFDQEFVLPPGTETEGIVEVVFEIHTGNSNVFGE